MSVNTKYTNLLAQLRQLDRKTITPEMMRRLNAARMELSFDLGVEEGVEIRDQIRRLLDDLLTPPATPAVDALLEALKQSL